MKTEEGLERKHFGTKIIEGEVDEAHRTRDRWACVVMNRPHHVETVRADEATSLL